MTIILRTVLLTALVTLLFAIMAILPPIPQGIIDMVETTFSYLHALDILFPMQTLIDVLTWVMYIEIGLLAVKIIAIIKRYTGD